MNDYLANKNYYYYYIKTVTQLRLTNDNVCDLNARTNSNSTSSFINGNRYLYAKADIEPPVPIAWANNIVENVCLILYASRDWKCMRCSKGHNTNYVDRCGSYTTLLEYVKVCSTEHFSNFNRCGWYGTSNFHHRWACISS